MEKLKKLIRMRRAVKTILFEGIPPSNAILAAHLGKISSHNLK
jgi:hypothetical protein